MPSPRSRQCHSQLTLENRKDILTFKMKRFCIFSLLVIVVFTRVWAQVPALFPTASQIFSDFLTVPISVADLIIDRVTTTGLFPVIYGAMSPIYNTVGRVQCSNAGNMFAFPILRVVLADTKDKYKSPRANVRTGRQLDFGGNYACPGTCAGGTCAPYTNMTTAPSSFSYFRCACPEKSCTAVGPVFQYSTIVQGTTIRCDPYEYCTCSGLAAGTVYKGYMCNWMNLQINQTIFLQASLPAQLNPIRWCACCAQPAGTLAMAATARPITAG